MLPIVNILNASSARFALLYNEKPQKCTEEEFVQSFQARQERARKDTQELKSHGLSLTQVAAKLGTVFAKANQCYKDECKQKTPMTQPIMVENKFKVTLLNMREVNVEHCAACDYTNNCPTNFMIIENLKTGRSVSFPTLSLHCFGTHNYCGDPASLYRLNALEASRVLELIK